MFLLLATIVTLRLGQAQVGGVSIFPNGRSGRVVLARWENTVTAVTRGVKERSGTAKRRIGDLAPS